jgi:hypothetical protein
MLLFLQNVKSLMHFVFVVFEKSFTLVLRDTGGALTGFGCFPFVS